MSKLEDLLQGVDVKWKALGDICIIKTGQSINKIQIDKNPGIYPVINSGKEPLGYINNWNTEDDPIGIASRGAGVGQVTWTSGKYFRGNLNYSVTILDKSIIQNKYLFYVLLSMQMQIHALCTFDGIPALNSSNLKKLLISIPPIEIQQEIVRVLDEFTSLTNQLTTELETERQNRKKQFEFFREQLFNNKNKNESWKTLDEIIIKTYSGSTPRAGDVQYYNNGTIPWLRTQEVRFCEIFDTEIKITELAVEKTAAKWIPLNCVIIAISGATAGRSAINKIPLTTNQHCLCLEINSDKALYKYVYHWVKFN